MMSHIWLVEMKLLHLAKKIVNITSLKNNISKCFQYFVSSMRIKDSYKRNNITFKKKLRLPDVYAFLHIYLADIWKQSLPMKVLLMGIQKTYFSDNFTIKSRALYGMVNEGWYEGWYLISLFPDICRRK